MQQTCTGPYARILRTAYEVFEAQDIDRLAKQLTSHGRQSGAGVKRVNRITQTLKSQRIAPRPTTGIKDGLALRHMLQKTLIQRLHVDRHRILKKALGLLLVKVAAHQISTTGYTASPHRVSGLLIMVSIISGTSLPSRLTQSRNCSWFTLPPQVAPPWISWLRRV